MPAENDDLTTRLAKFREDLHGVRFARSFLVFWGIAALVFAVISGSVIYSSHSKVPGAEIPESELSRLLNFNANKTDAITKDDPDIHGLADATKNADARTSYLHSMARLSEEKQRRSWEQITGEELNQWYLTILPAGFAGLLFLAAMLQPLRVPIDLAMTRELAAVDWTKLAGTNGEPKPESNQKGASALPPALVRSVLLDSRFDELLKEYQEKYRKEHQEQRESSDESTNTEQLQGQAAWRAIVKRFVRDPVFAYLLKEKALPRADWSDRLPDLADKFKSKEKGSEKSPLGAMSNTLLLWGALGAVAVGGYLSSTLVERTIRETTSSLYDRLVTLDTRLHETSVTLSAESNRIDKLTEKEGASFFYYPLDLSKTNERAGNSFIYYPVSMPGTGGTEVQPPPPPVASKCAPSDTDRANQDCSPRWIIETASCCGTGLDERHLQQTAGGLLVPFPPDQKPVSCKGGDEPNSFTEPVRIAYFDSSNSRPASGSCYELTLDQWVEKKSDIIKIDISLYDPKGEYTSLGTTFAGKTPIYSPQLNANLSIEKNSQWKWWKPKDWFLKYGKLVIRISPLPSEAPNANPGGYRYRTSPQTWVSGGNR